MIKTIYLIMGLLLTLSVNATTFCSETFSTGSLPNTWSIFSGTPNFDVNGYENYGMSSNGVYGFARYPSSCYNSNEMRYYRVMLKSSQITTPLTMLYVNDMNMCGIAYNNIPTNSFISVRHGVTTNNGKVSLENNKWYIYECKFGKDTDGKYKVGSKIYDIDGNLIDSLGDFETQNTDLNSRLLETKSAYILDNFEISDTPYQGQVISPPIEPSQNNCTTTKEIQYINSTIIPSEIDLVLNTSKCSVNWIGTLLRLRC